MNTPPLFRLEIAPIIVLPLSRSPFFSYASRLPLAIGSVVSISFGKQTVRGVVFRQTKLLGKVPSWMKQVGKIIHEGYLTDDQLALACFVSEEYYAPLGNVLKHFIPDRVKARKHQENPLVSRSILRANQKEKEVVERWMQGNEKKPTYFDTRTLPEPKRMRALCVKRIRAMDKQCLILVPEIALVPGMAESFGKYFVQDDIVILHSQLPDGVYSDHWERIRSGAARIIIATRQGLFAPYANLGLIIVDEEQDESYKQWDMSPKYETLRVAKQSALLHRARLLLSSATPGAESMYHVEKQDYDILLPLVETEPLGERLSLVNLKLERYHKNYSPLSELLVTKIRETLQAKRQALLFINRQGMSAFSVCGRCRAVFSCPTCGRALTGGTQGDFHCSGCGHHTILFPSCPGCGHLTFRHIGFGTERIEREITRIFPWAKVARADGRTMRTFGNIQTLHRQGLAGEIDILIGTQMILKDPPLPNLALVAMIDADSWLAFPDFRSDERLFQQLSRATRQVTETGIVIIQTYHPESTLFQRIAGLGSKDYYTRLLSEREALSYPPFSRLIAIACLGKTEQEVTKKTAIIHRKLTSELVSSQGKINEPQTPRRFNRGTSYKSILLLRIRKDTEVPIGISDLLKKLGPGCSVDVDPLLMF